MCLVICEMSWSVLSQDTKGKAKTKTVKDCLKTRQCFETSHHWLQIPKKLLTFVSYFCNIAVISAYVQFRGTYHIANFYWCGTDMAH